MDSSSSSLRRLDSLLRHTAGSSPVSFELGSNDWVATFTFEPQQLEQLQLSMVGTAAEKKSMPSLVLKNNKTGEEYPLATPISLTDKKGKDGGAGDDKGFTSFILLSTKPSSQTLTVLDNRTGKTYEIPIENNSINANFFSKVKLSNEMEGLRLFDPGYQNTAVCKSQICYIDGDKGILRYRGYPIEELAEKSTFLEVAFLLIYGDLPTPEEAIEWNNQIMRHTLLHFNLNQLMKSFNYDAHPMGMFISVISAMSTFHPEANPSLTDADIYLKDERIRNIQIYRLLGKAATIAACSYRHRIGRQYNLPQANMSYTENFLYMLDHLSEDDYRPNPVLCRALEVLFILHAEHELNCSTAAMRHISSSHVDPFSAVAGAASALYGPLHGGACEAVLRMLEEIGSVDKIPEFIEDVKLQKRKLMGFGHRVYKNYDPRAKIIKKTAYEVFKVVGKEPLIEIAIKLEEYALNDEYFIKRKLYPNVDYYSGLIYKSMGFPTDFFPVLFAIPRVAGWLAHWNEAIQDASGKIWRPRQLYVGEEKRNYVPLEHRQNSPRMRLHSYRSRFGIRSRSATYVGKSVN